MSLKEGDKNTKSFHASVKENRSRKGVEKLMDSNGIEQRSEAAKGLIATSYFSSLFTSSNPYGFEELFSDFQPRVSSRMNENVNCHVSKIEVTEAIFAIKTSSSPGADGMTRLFFQHYWDIIGQDVRSVRYKVFSPQALFLLIGTTLFCALFRKRFRPRK